MSIINGLSERDVFHTGNPDTTLWEFKHGNGNFKRGDLVGLREIKRRASRHALVHRESNYTKSATSQPGTPAEPMPIPQDGPDARLINIEHTLYDLGSRLQRSDEAAHYMHVKNQAAMETMGRLLHFNQELSRAVLSLVPTDSPISRDGSSPSTRHCPTLANMRSYRIAKRNAETSRDDPLTRRTPRAYLLAAAIFRWCRQCPSVPETTRPRRPATR